MGDVVFTLPSARLLRENFPRAKITYLTSLENKAIVEEFPGVDEVLAIDRRLFKKPGWRTFTHTLDLLKRMRQGKFSLVIDLQGYAETALLARLTGAPRRWAWATGRKFRHHAYTQALPRADHLHPVELNLDLLTGLGLKLMPVANEFQLSERGHAEARQFMADQGLDLKVPILLVQPFTSSPHKNWPLNKYLTVAGHWRTKGFQIIFSGGPGRSEERRVGKECRS